ncbi:hypothetical protein [Enterobacter roggenkampii]|uniref:hypothetical protein n=1 Tax=Enterobacter roggenkampii TaxID=1812935 RepID=UPI00210D33B7|nr:hypothetical protein [Enterobacter roggenkampii]MCQ4391740.1 hypothetical protein [Enterobacter roggenkampii]HDR2381695.1 hypothetical protein [Enterobacter roggenkampii]
METQISDHRLMNDLSQQQGFDLAKLKNINCFSFSQSKPKLITQTNQVQEESESDVSEK